MIEDFEGLDRTTELAYTPDDQLKTQTAINGATNDQVSAWTYGTVLGETGSDVASNDLLRFEDFPLVDSGTGRRVEYR